MPEKTLATAIDRPSPRQVADHTIRIATGLIEVEPNRILSTTTYNGMFPGPLLRLKEGRPVSVDIHNDTDTPEQFHWHGQRIPVDVDGSSEEGTPFIPAHGNRRIEFTPGPAGFRFYHTHTAGREDLSAGQYSGQVGPLYIEPRREPGAYDREVFLTLKEFVPSLARGGDMVMDFLSPSTIVSSLKALAEQADRDAKGKPKGFEVGYDVFTINGKMLGHGEPIRVKPGERVLFHVLNGSATEIRSLALPGHQFKVVALDGNPVPRPATVPVLWIGTGERISAIVEMNHAGVWVLGDLSDEDRSRGMGIVIEYAGRKGKPQWLKPAPFRWDYIHFTKAGAISTKPDQMFRMTFAKQQAADHGFNRWTINGKAYAMGAERMHDMTGQEAMLQLKLGRRYRLQMRNASDDIHPIHLHRHTFELTRFAGHATAGLLKDVVMVGGFQEVEIDFTADQPGLSLFHCHMQLHMDFGFMALFQCA
ncbi:MAG: multicopper oxidase domain-containing protein [Chthonomonadales bacterium]